MIYLLKALLTLFLISTAITASAQMVAVSSLSQNVVQLNKKNRLQIVVENSSCNSLVVSTDNGKIHRVSPCMYDYSPSRSGMAQIVVFSSARRDAYNYLLRVESTARNNNLSEPEVEIPIVGPTAFVGKRNGGFVTKNEFLVQTGVYVKAPEDDRPKYIVKSFTYLISRDNRTLATNYNHAPTFTKELKRDIETIQSGDRILFYNINAIDYNSRTIWVLPIEFIIL